MDALVPSASNNNIMTAAFTQDDIEMKTDLNINPALNEVTPASVYIPKTLKEITCVICLDAPGRYKFGVDCPYHRICDDCFDQYSVNEVIHKQAVTVKCPVPGCTHNYVSTRLSSTMFDKVVENRRNAMRVCKTCPLCVTDGTLRLGSFDRTVGSRLEVKCGTCRSTFCLFCYDPIRRGSWFGCGGALDRIRWRGRPCCRERGGGHFCKNPDNALLQQHARDPAQQVKPCPQCFKLIHRSEGCRNMQCSGVGLGCGTSFCWDCLSILGPGGGAHNCEAVAVKTRMSDTCMNVTRPVVLAAASTATFLARALLFVVAAPAFPFVLVYRTYRKRKERTDARERLLRDAPRTIGVDLFNVPDRAVHEYLRRQANTTEAAGGTHVIGRFSQNGRCYRAFRLFGDGHTIVNLHTHDQDEPCELVNPRCYNIASRRRRQLRTERCMELPLSHTFAAEDFAGLAPINDEELDAETGMSNKRTPTGMLQQDVQEQLQKGIQFALARFREETSGTWTRERVQPRTKAAASLPESDSIVVESQEGLVA